MKKFGLLLLICTSVSRTCGSDVCKIVAIASKSSDEGKVLTAYGYFEKKYSLLEIGGRVYAPFLETPEGLLPTEINEKVYAPFLEPPEGLLSTRPSSRVPSYFEVLPKMRDFDNFFVVGSGVSYWGARFAVIQLKDGRNRCDLPLGGPLLL